MLGETPSFLPVKGAGPRTHAPVLLSQERCLTGCPHNHPQIALKWTSFCAQVPPGNQRLDGQSGGWDFEKPGRVELQELRVEQLRMGCSHPSGLGPVPGQQDPREELFICLFIFPNLWLDGFVRWANSNRQAYGNMVSAMMNIIEWPPGAQHNPANGEGSELNPAGALTS